jgi:hypothetical protein
MGKHVIQIPSEDGCLYVYDVDKQTLKKLCDIERLEDIPADVLETLNMANLRVRVGTD